MSGNTFGTLFTVTTFGESHGPAIGCIVDGCPPGLPLSEADIQPELDRRRPGTSRHVTQRQEPDTVEILSGVYQGKTTGTPISLLIRNQDQRSKDYGNITDSFRPGHADFTYWKKYGIRDPRGGGRSSARLTAPVVAAGAIAKKWLLAKFGTTFTGGMRQIGEVAIPFQSWEYVNQNPFFAPTADAAVLQQLGRCHATGSLHTCEAQPHPHSTFRKRKRVGQSEGRGIEHRCHGGSRRRCYRPCRCSRDIQNCGKRFLCHHHGNGCIRQLEPPRLHRLLHERRQQLIGHTHSQPDLRLDVGRL